MFLMHDDNEGLITIMVSLFFFSRGLAFLETLRGDVLHFKSKDRFQYYKSSTEKD